MNDLHLLALEPANPGLTGIGIGSDEMVEDFYNRSIRDRIESVNERVIKAEGRQEAHEQICAQLNTQILKDIEALRIYIQNVAKWGLLLAVGLFLVEIGKATAPGIVEVLTKVLH